LSRDGDQRLVGVWENGRLRDDGQSVISNGVTVGGGSTASLVAAAIASGSDGGDQIDGGGDANGNGTTTTSTTVSPTTERLPGSPFVGGAFGSQLGGNGLTIQISASSGSSPSSSSPSSSSSSTPTTTSPSTEITGTTDVAQELRRSGTYRGQTRNGLPHGRGTFVYFAAAPMANYTGQWVNGRKTGRGTMVWKSGDR